MVSSFCYCWCENNGKMVCSFFIFQSFLVIVVCDYGQLQLEVRVDFLVLWLVVVLYFYSFWIEIFLCWSSFLLIMY